MNKSILLSFDVEEFDMPLEYEFPINITEQMALGMEGLQAIDPVLNYPGIVSTLFTTANFADYFPSQIVELSKKHEIASHTYFHSQFENKDLLDSKLKLEELTGKTIKGLRMPRMKTIEGKIIAQAGYQYDASIHPTWLPGRYNNLDLSRTPYFENELLRIPASVSPKLRIPLFWLSFKNFPLDFYTQLAIKTLKNDGFISLYFHPWEFINIRHYNLPRYTRNICGDALVERLQKLLKSLKAEGDFMTMNEYAMSIMEQSTSSDVVKIFSDALAEE